MTGVGWLDAVAFALFVGLALLLAAELVRDRSGRTDRASAVLHLTMAVGMAAMSQPRPDPLAPEVWMLAFVATAAGTLVQCVGRRGRGGRGDRPLTRPYDHLVASLLMVVAFAGHGSGAGTHTMIDPANGAVTTMSGAGGHHAATSPLAQSIGAATTWPIWSLVGLGFVAYALWLTVGLVLAPSTGPGRAADAACRCTGSKSERACGIVMAAAMGVMALTL